MRRTSSELDGIWRKIAGGIRDQYSIGYFSKNRSHDGAFRPSKCSRQARMAKPCRYAPAKAMSHQTPVIESIGKRYTQCFLPPAAAVHRLCVLWSASGAVARAQTLSDAVPTQSVQSCRAGRRTVARDPGRETRFQKRPTCTRPYCRTGFAFDREVLPEAPRCLYHRLQERASLNAITSMLGRQLYAAARTCSSPRHTDAERLKSIRHPDFGDSWKRHVVRFSTGTANRKKESRTATESGPSANRRENAPLSRHQSARQNGSGEGMRSGPMHRGIRSTWFGEPFQRRVYEAPIEFGEVSVSAPRILPNWGTEPAAGFHHCGAFDSRRSIRGLASHGTEVKPSSRDRFFPPTTIAFFPKAANCGQCCAGSSGTTLAPEWKTRFHVYPYSAAEVSARKR